MFPTIGASTTLYRSCHYFQPRYSVAEAAAAGVTNLQAAGFSVTDALAASVTDLRSAGCPGLEVRNPGEVKGRQKVLVSNALVPTLEGSVSAVWIERKLLRLFKYDF